MTYVLMIAGMGALTLGIRAAVFLLGDRLQFPPLARQALDFVPVAVLTAIVVPVVAAPQGGELALTWRNPQLVAAVVAVAVCAVTRHQLLTIAVAMAAFFAWRFGVLG